MQIQLEKFQCKDLDFKPPTGHNGEDLELVSVELSGNFLVARYFNPVPVSGPRIDRYLVDLYLNGEGHEAFRVSAKVLDPPPVRPTFKQRLAFAFQILWG